VLIVSVSVNAQQEVKFTGTAIEYFHGGLGGRRGWRVRVDNMIFGPQLTGYTVEVYIQSLLPPWDYMDPEIRKGDTVEAYGLYEDSGGTHRVSLLGSEDYYLKKVTLKPVGGYLLPADKLSLLLPYLISLMLFGAVVAVVVIKRKSRD
jgi:hypothetical protein